MKLYLKRIWALSIFVSLQWKLLDYFSELNAFIIITGDKIISFRLIVLQSKQCNVYLLPNIEMLISMNMPWAQHESQALKTIPAGTICISG